MLVEPVRTRLVRAGEISIEDLLAESIKTLSKNSVVVVSSKVVALCENRIVKTSEISKEDLIKQESDFWVDAELSKYNHHFTITKGTLISASGIDESNSGGSFVLWPKNPMESANKIRKFLNQKFAPESGGIGVIISDSTVMPLRLGVVGIAIGWSGFRATRNLAGTEDLFGRKFNYSLVALGQQLATAGNVVMGEGNEQTPIAIISDIPFVEFHDHDPTPEEIAATFVDKNEDLFAPFLDSVAWQKGGSGYENRAKMDS